MLNKNYNSLKLKKYIKVMGSGYNSQTGGSGTPTLTPAKTITKELYIQTLNSHYSPFHKPA